MFLKQLVININLIKATKPVIVMKFSYYRIDNNNLHTFSKPVNFLQKF